MKNLSVLVDDDLHRKVKIESAKKGQNIKEFLLCLIAAYFSEQEEKDAKFEN